MYVVKVGDYYVKRHDTICKDNGYMYVGEIILSREIMRNYSKEFADYLANKLNGEVVKIAEEVTNEKK